MDRKNDNGRENYGKNKMEGKIKIIKKNYKLNTNFYTITFINEILNKMKF